MKNPPAVKEGDRVRVVLEGEVTYDDSGYFEVGDLGMTGDIDAVQSIEVLKSPVKVGDTVLGADALDALPRGTVLEMPDGGSWLIKGCGGWLNAYGDGFSVDCITAPRTVAYLPGVAA